MDSDTVILMNKAMITFLAVLTVGMLVGGGTAVAQTTSTTTTTIVWDETLRLVGPNTGTTVQQGGLIVATERIYNGIHITGPSTTVAYDPVTNTTNTTTVSHSVGFDTEWVDLEGQNIVGVPVGKFDVTATVDNVILNQWPDLSGISGGVSHAPYTTPGSYKFIFVGEKGEATIDVLIRVHTTTTTTITQGPPA